MQSHYRILTAFMLLLCFYAYAQSASQENMPISWDNGNITIMKDLGNVWIYTGKGHIIKKVRIWEIQKEKLMMVYECEGTLHDLLIANIEKITPGQNSHDFLYFDGATPKIKMMDYYYEFESSTFKISYTAEQMRQASVKSSSVQPGGKTGTVSSTGKSTVNDTMQFADGSLQAVRITAINPAEIKYIRADVPNGPVYTIINDQQTEIKRHSSYLKIIIKN